MARKPDQATIDRMMTVAEQLYGERGIAAVSLREIGVAAGSRNNNAVQYHFGGVSELITAILRRRLPEVERERARLLDRIKASSASPGLKCLIGALYLPLLTLADEQGNHTHARLHLALLNHPQDYLWSNPFQDQQPTAGEILQRIAALLPMPEILYFERLRLATMMVLNSLFNRPPPLDRGALAPYLLESVLDMAAAALSAPLPTADAAMPAAAGDGMSPVGTSVLATWLPAGADARDGGQDVPGAPAPAPDVGQPDHTPDTMERGR